MARTVTGEYVTSVEGCAIAGELPGGYVFANGGREYYGHTFCERRYRLRESAFRTLPATATARERTVDQWQGVTCPKCLEWFAEHVIERELAILTASNVRDAFLVGRPIYVEEDT